MPLLIFDCDGVLVDSEYLFARVACECLAEIGIAISAEEAARRFAGVSIKDMLVELARERGAAFPEGFLAHLMQREDEAYARGLEPLPGVRDAILSLDLPRCVASASASAIFCSAAFCRRSTNSVSFVSASLARRSASALAWATMA